MQILVLAHNSIYQKQLAKHVNTRAQGIDKFEMCSFDDAQDRTKPTAI